MYSTPIFGRRVRKIRKMMKKNRIYKKYTHRHTDNAKKIKAKQNKAKKENKQSTHTQRE